jgi:hypothetical protein
MFNSNFNLTEKVRMNLKFAICIILLFITIAGCKSNSDDKPVIEKKDYKILFIGNSFTFYNDGIDYHLKNMLRVEKSSDSMNYLVQKIAVSSYTLEAHFEDPLTMQKIKSDKWNMVILQEQSTRPINNPDLFLEFAAKLDTEIKKSGAEVSFFMTWAPKDTPAEINQIAASYETVGVGIKDKVIPVGRVWEYFVKNNQAIDLYYTDKKHPSLAGTYLATCVFYYSVFNKNPVENSYLPVGLSTDNAITIRRIVQDYFSTNK